jgi:thiamine pyrophosphokinase
MLSKRVWIFVNGDLANPEWVKAMIQPDDLLIAADGGLRHLRALGLKPVAVIGDLDSITADEYEQLVSEGITVEKYPPAKDETDLELALSWALSTGIHQIRIAAAQGDRFDHTLGNLFLLMQPALVDCDVRLEDGRDEVFLIRSEGRIEGTPGDRVSLLPLGKPAAGVSTQKLQYPLSNETLLPEQTRGISNVMLAAAATVWVDDGLLICIHTRLT